MRNILSLLAFCAFIPSVSHAGDWYFGAKTGPMLFDTDGVSNPQNGGVLLGWEQGIVVGDLGFEAEITRSLKDGDFNNEDLSVDVQALYGVYRTPGPIYFKAKAGIVSKEASLGPLSEDDSGSSIGLGIGFSLKLIKFELEYAKYDENIEFGPISEDVDYLSVSIIF